MKKSPFPGMDPFLERHWRDVHTSLMIYTRDQIQSQLPADLLARVEEGVSVDTADAVRLVYPDVRVVEDSSPDVFSSNGGGAAVAVAEPLIVPVDEKPKLDRHIEIIDSSSGGRVVTAIEFLSPKNKVAVPGREAYQRKQGEYIAGGVNLVEVDLIRVGEFVLAAQLDVIAPKNRKHYMMCVRRVLRPQFAAIYGAGLRDRLPTIPVPLRPKDQDVALNLQELIDLCYERGRYFKIDYQRPLEPPLPSDDAAWAGERIERWRTTP